MSNASNIKIALTEIADYRGNLSFAEENNPIPFEIKSVLWSTVSEDITFALEAQSFLIVLDGKLNINGEQLARPNQAYLAKENTSLELKVISEEAIILLVMDKMIGQKDASKSVDNNMLQMPITTNFYGLKGYFANSESTVPFDIKRVYFTYDIPEFAERGGHAHKELESVIFALTGGFDVILDNGENRFSTRLDKVNTGLNIKPAMWRDIENFKNKSLLMVLASDTYSEADYIRNYHTFKQN